MSDAAAKVAAAVCCGGGGDVLPGHGYVSENTGTDRTLEASRVTWLGIFADKTEVRKSSWRAVAGA